MRGRLRREASTRSGLGPGIRGHTTTGPVRAVRRRQKRWVMTSDSAVVCGPRRPGRSRGRGRRTLYRDVHEHPGAVAPGGADGGAGRRPAPGRRVRGARAGRAAPGWSASCATGTAPTVLLRADMDALPVREATGLPYASTVTAHRRRWQRGAGDARLRPRRPRGLPGRGRAAARRRQASTGRGTAGRALPAGRGGRRRRARHGRGRARRADPDARTWRWPST